MSKHIRDFPSSDLNLVALVVVYEDGAGGPAGWLDEGSELRVEHEVRDEAAWQRYQNREVDNSTGQCACCGHGLVYSCVVEHVPTGEFYGIGRDCFANIECLQEHAGWLSYTSDRAVARVAAGKKAAKERKAGDVREGKFAEEQPGLTALLAWAQNPPVAQDHPSYHHISYAVAVLSDLRSTVRRYGKLSDKQAAFAVKIHAEAVEKLAADEARAAAVLAAKAAGLRAPEGRCEVTGKLVSVKFVENDFGGSYKCLVDFGNGTRAWGSYPGSGTGDRGDSVRFRASFEVSDKDPLFAFFKRPSKWAVVEPEAAAA
jgi:hypothetical protein